MAACRSESVAAMQAIGAWMKVNGEAIYATGGQSVRQTRLGALHRQAAAQRQDAAVPARFRLAQGWHARGPAGERLGGAGAAAGRRKITARHRCQWPDINCRGEPDARQDRHRNRVGPRCPAEGREVVLSPEHAPATSYHLEFPAGMRDGGPCNNPCLSVANSASSS